ncbi:hypothetical protein D3C81_1983510 [compost metagenome]
MNSRAAKPTTGAYASTVCQSLAKASTMVKARNSAATSFMGFSMRVAKPGAQRRIIMPKATGSRTMANTCMTLANCNGMA